MIELTEKLPVLKQGSNLRAMNRVDIRIEESA